jgi:hypothetical protein
MMRKKTKELAHKEDEDKDSYKEDEDEDRRINYGGHVLILTTHPNVGWATCQAASVGPWLVFGSRKRIVFSKIYILHKQDRTS